MLANHLTAARRLGPRSRDFARHVWQKIAALTIGRLFVSDTGRRLRGMLAGLRAPAAVPTVRTAILVHAYYPELLPEILACRSILPGTVPLHITVPPDRAAAAEAELIGIPDVTIHVCENRGRDIWPFIHLLNTGCFDACDAVLKLHTKRSPHLLDGEIRRKLLFAMLCGERNATLKALAAFERSETGLVGWEACWREAPPYWMANRERVEQIALRMRVPASARRLGFFEGSMFWFRPQALTTLRELSLNLDDFESEAGQVDGTLHHALERCFTIAAWAGSFEVRDLKGRLLSGARD